MVLIVDWMLGYEREIVWRPVGTLTFGSNPLRVLRNLRWGAKKGLATGSSQRQLFGIDSVPTSLHCRMFQ